MLVAALVALPCGSTLAQTGFVLGGDALGSGGGPATSGPHAVGAIVGQNVAGAAVGGPYREYAGLWRPGMQPTLGVGPELPGAPPVQLALLPVAPNPSRGTCTFYFGVPASGADAPFRFRIYDVAGRCITELRTGPPGPGWHRMTWDGRDATGAQVGLGVFFCHVDAAGAVTSRRFVLVH